MRALLRTGARAARRRLGRLRGRWAVRRLVVSGGRGVPEGLARQLEPVLVVCLGATAGSTAALARAWQEDQVRSGMMRPVFLVDGGLEDVVGAGYVVEAVVPRTRWDGEADWDDYVAGHVQRMSAQYGTTRTMWAAGSDLGPFSRFPTPRHRWWHR